MKKKKLSHIDSGGRAKMVDVSAKPVAVREAVAEASVSMKQETWRLAAAGGTGKGEVFSTARIAAIQAAKKTADLIPLCHPLPVGEVDVDFTRRPAGAGRSLVVVRATVRGEGQTGFEMEAMVAASVAALVLYDMCKGVDRWMSVKDVRLLSKKGGTSGSLARPGLRKSPRKRS